ncbi:MAG: hypothetical protein A2650_04785 [Candidatus Yanofskybacteria bacterium RIFCSPHIGHO2_01_FULL_41_53]|uniref:Uncharacterized protein n=1 Tax=Candidatus Yanofskybacteria bacterium RIFCSPHIGHO2_01_FULL_41_53 TaxID=1802663 RepID=A0A1F8ELW3_9BACT|nr:MAG: hypothetical protein A2650_04785 [Candidatus Yanofskybacteria bacterium RIFCSPHIGHO2_01_FULL_41_53]OGN24849.1 MAG: hypothetical protein A2916_04510 [Candidatus Yanofskybacteria bacterium RIFCSPLOWO2_01_FULL_41_67]OGN28994.1 MAG: hypothetical protein A3H54_03275 [Candidatus Yanofskybacteria bacterium RIFCSPLOWO2_02_FULL_41_13]
MPLFSSNYGRKENQEKRENIYLLPLHQEERTMPRKALFTTRGTSTTNQIPSSKGFFVEPRYGESFG